MKKISGGAQEIVTVLRQRLDVTWHNLISTISCFEIFRVAARDKDLIDRLGASFSTGAFVAICGALYKEVVLSLMRIWDRTAKNNLRIEDIISNLTRPEVISFIKNRRQMAFSDGEDKARATAEVDREIKQIQLIKNRITHGSLKKSFEALEQHRNEFLAHTTLGRSPASVIRNAVYGDERYLLRWSAVLIKKLNLLVDDLHTDPSRDIRSFKVAARCFWGPVRAETIKERKTARASSSTGSG